MEPSHSNDMLAFKEVLAASNRIIAVAGAGLSAASGIPTFRGTGGMWRKHDVMTLAVPEAFAANPSRVWQFYHYRRETARKAQPNAAHEALAKFSLAMFRESVAPSSTFTLITQNVDGLSRRALDSIVSVHGESAPAQVDPLLLEMHGCLFGVRCTKETCGACETIYDSPICSALAGTEKLVESDNMESDIPLKDLPRCRECGALVRPDVVWFGEVPYHLDDIFSLAEEADLCLVVGTSSVVYPAAGLASQVKEAGGKVAVFNLERSNGDSEADFLFLGPCEELLPRALGMRD